MDNEPTLEKVLQTIEVQAQYDLAISWIEEALPIWDAFAKDENNLSYFDGIGGFYNVEKDILANTIQSIKEERLDPGTNMDIMVGLYDSFHTFILGINRADWELPEPANRTFCATFNLLGLVATMPEGAEEQDRLNLTINQAADALMSGNIKSQQEINKELRLVMINNRKRTENPDGAAD